MIKNLLARGGVSLDRLQNFSLVAERGGIAKAVGNNLSRQALVSRQIRELEDFFKVELTRRHGKGLEITEAGHELARVVRLAFAGLGDFQTRVAQAPVEVRLAAGNSVLEWLLIPRLARLEPELRGIQVRLFDLRNAETVGALREHAVDLGVVRNTITAPLKFRRLAEIGYRLYVPKSMARRGADASRYPLALSLGGEFYREATKLAAKAHVVLQVQWRCASFTQAARLVQEGVCAAILPELATPFVGDKAVAMELPWLSSYRRKIGFAWHPRQLEARPAVGKVLEMLGRVER